jgi:hypothetical protein
MSLPKLRRILKKSLENKYSWTRAKYFTCHLQFMMKSQEVVRPSAMNDHLLQTADQKINVIS